MFKLLRTVDLGCLVEVFGLIGGCTRDTPDENAFTQRGILTVVLFIGGSIQEWVI